MARDDTLTTRFEANIIHFETELRRLNRLNERAVKKVASDHERAAKQTEQAWRNANIGGAVEKSMQNVGPTLRRYAGLIAGMFAGREALNAADTYTRFSNSLKIAGLEGAALKQVQDSLYDTAQKNGVALEPLAELYGRAAQSAKELGANQQSLIKFTNGVSAALRVGGSTAASAQGALLQLSQALGAGIVRAEEFNSINEGARPILEAVAKGSDQYAGSVAKLRAAVLEGKVTSREFFDAFLKGSADLEAKAARAPLTVGQSMTILQNALVKFIGETDKSLGITDRLSAAIRLLSENLGPLTQALIVIGGLYAATFVPALGRSAALLGANTAATVRSTAASIADTGALIARTAAIHGVSTASATAAVAARGLGSALAFFGGPLGIAVMAVGAAVAYLGVSSAKAAMEAQALHDRINAKNAALRETARASVAARAEQGQLTKEEYAAAVGAAKLTGEASKLANKLYLVAAAAKAAAIETARLGLAQARQDTLDAQRQYARKESQEVRKATGPQGDGVDRRASGMAEAMGLRSNRDLGRDLGRSAAQQSQEAKDLKTAQQNERAAQAELDRIRNQKLAEYLPAPASAVPGKESKKKGGGGRDKADEAARRAEASEEAVRQAEKAYRDAVRGQADTAEERHAANKEALVAERDEAIAALQRRAAKNEITQASADLAKSYVNQTHEVKLATENLRRSEEVTQHQREVTRLETDHRVQLLRLDEQEMLWRSETVDTLKDRQEFERKALRKKQEADDLAFKVAQDQLEVEREKLGFSREEINRLRQDAQSNRNREKQFEADQQGSRHASEGPRSWDKWLKDLSNDAGSLNEQLQSVADNGLNNIVSGLTDAVMGAKSLKEAFAGMARSIIADLVQMAIKFAIFEAIGMAFGMPGLGRASIGIGKNVSGTNYWRGGPTLVGENGPEVAWLSQGSQVLPNNLLRSAVQTPQKTVGSGGTVNVYTTVNANDAVLTSTVQGWIYDANRTAVQHAQRLNDRVSFKRQQNRLGR